MKNIFKIASLLAAAVMLFACEKVSSETGLEIVSDRDVIQSNGQDAATLRVLFRGQDVTDKATFYDEEDNPVTLQGGKFTASSEGEYKFWPEVQRDLTVT